MDYMKLPQVGVSADTEYALFLPNVTSVYLTVWDSFWNHLTDLVTVADRGSAEFCNIKKEMIINVGLSYYGPYLGLKECDVTFDLQFD